MCFAHSLVCVFFLVSFSQIKQQTLQCVCIYIVYSYVKHHHRSLRKNVHLFWFWYVF